MKEGLEKDTKKLDNSGVKDVETSSDSGKKKGKEERPPTKVVVRRLPPTMTEEEFLQQIDPLPPIDYMYYVPADNSLSPHSFCRAYLNFVNQSDIFIFTQKFDGYVFVDSKGIEYPAVVEFAPFQRIPKQRSGRKRDPKAGTIESDPLYTSFFEKLQVQMQENSSAGSNIKQHFFETNVTSNEENKVNTTPLLDYLRTRYAERLRIREEKRKKDLERKRARDEQRRNAKKAEEDSSILKPPVLSVKPKSEDERLLVQQTIFLRKLLGLPNPFNSTNQGSCSEGNEGIRCSSSSPEENIVALKYSLTTLSKDVNFCLDRGMFPEHRKYPKVSNDRSKYSLTNRNGMKLNSSNAYCRRYTSMEGSKTRRLWSESKYVNYMKPNGNFSVKPICNKWKHSVIPKFDKHGLPSSGIFEESCNAKQIKFNLEKELLDENALEAFPTFEESRLHKLQKHILKAPLIQTTPIRKQSVEEIKLKFQLWSHDVTTKSCLNKKKEIKKSDFTQIKIMKPPSRFCKNGINQNSLENNETRQRAEYESIIKECPKPDKILTNVNVKCEGDGSGYFKLKNHVKDCQVNEVDVAQYDKSNASTNNSRFLISNNLQLPKAFSSGKKQVSDTNICLTSNGVIKTTNISNDGLPKAFNSLLKCESQKRSCHQSLRNETIICSSEGSTSNSDNINRKTTPCSIIC